VTSATPPSGEQYEISFGEQVATVVEVGGGVRTYTWGERPVLEPYPLEAMCDGAHGAPLVPWPNRLGDGRYSWDGADHQVALTEPDKHNAIHGFLRWRSWQAVAHEPDRVVMGTRLHPLTGYPFTLDVQVAYRLDDTGLTVQTTATNVGDAPCPYGSGQHPYLSPGFAASGEPSVVDDCLLEIPAAVRVLTDDARQLPTGTAPVDGTAFDFRSARRLGDLAIDYAFCELTRDDAGRATVRLTGPDGCTAELWVDGTYPYVEVYTGDTLAPSRRRRGLGTEPMTCPPDAFASGRDVHRLAPGQALTSTWGTRLT
jgi:aldose 1-epimerase